MHEKPIKVPIEKVNFADNSDFQVVDSDVSSLKDSMAVGSDGFMDISLAKLVQFLLRYDQDELLHLHGKELVKIAPSFLVELAGHDVGSEVDGHKVSWMLSGLVLGVFVGLIIFLIFLK